MWIIFYKLDKNLKVYQKLILTWIILFTFIVMLYDFIFLIPYQTKFNESHGKCNSYFDMEKCSISYYGLLSLKIFFNYRINFLFEFIASAIFVFSSTIWIFRLIIKPYIQSKIKHLYAMSYFKNNFMLNKI